MDRGDAAAATWIFSLMDRGDAAAATNSDESRRRRGRGYSAVARLRYEAATGNVRPGQYDHSAQAAEASKLAADSLSGGFYDWADARLFAFAVERFGGSPLPPALAHGLALAKMDPGRTGSRA